MKTKSKFISVGIFTLFFFIGWKIGDSPLNYSLKTVKEQANIVKHRLFQIPYINIAANYIAETQDKIDVIHYNLNFNLFPKEKLLIGFFLIKGLPKDINVFALQVALRD